VIKTSRKLLLWVAGLILAGFAAAVVLVTIWTDPDRLGDQLQEELSRVFDQDVSLERSPRLLWWRGPVFEVGGIELSDADEAVARIDSARVRLSVPVIFFGQLRPSSVTLEGAELLLERLDIGQFNLDLAGARVDSIDSLSVRRLRLTDVSLDFRDHPSGQAWRFDNCELDLRRVRHDGGELENVLATLAANGRLGCEQLSSERFKVSDWSVQIEGEQGQFEITPTDTEVLGGELSGQLLADLTNGPPEYQLSIELSGIDIGEFLAVLADDQGSSGSVDLALDLEARGQRWLDVRSTLAGRLEIHAEELVLEGRDLDEELDGYAATQRFNLIDLGAIALVGPAGLIASRGYAFAGLLEGNDGSTRIAPLISHWRFDQGVAHAEDVAFRTEENRVALSGGLDGGRCWD
jgi:uncharacterized protein involved in outer membrane biogenesis